MPEKTIKGKFKPSSAAERAFYRQLKKVAQSSGHIVERHADGAKLTNEQSMMDELKKYSEKLGPWAIKQSAKMLQQVQKSNKRAYQQKSKAIGVALQLGVAEQDVGTMALALLNEQVGLIKSIPLEAGLRAQKIAYEAVIAGTRAEANTDTIRQLEEEMGLSTEVAISRATLIARTETARANAAINQARAVSVGSNQYRWHNSRDESVRPSHKKYKGKRLQGMIFSWDDPPTLDDGMTGHPGTFPNCLPGSANLNGSPFIEKFYRYRYAGELSQLIFKDGGVLSATPHHPILTLNGLKPIKLLGPGEYVICEKGQRFDTIKPHIHGFDISFEKLFGSINALDIFIKSTAIGGQFHGDVTNEEVDIISPNGRLIREIGVIVNQKFLELSFSNADMRLMRRLFDCSSRSFPDFSWLLFSSDCGMRSFDLLSSLLRRHFTPLELFCFSLVSYIYSGKEQVLSNNNPGHLQFLGDVVFAYSILIHGFDFIDVQMNRRISAPFSSSTPSIYPESPQALADHIRANTNQSGDLNKGLSGRYELLQVLQNGLVPFNSTHVYNLQTVVGYYVADSSYQGNCRCFAEPIFIDE